MFLDHIDFASELKVNFLKLLTPCKRQSCNRRFSVPVSSFDIAAIMPFLVHSKSVGVRQFYSITDMKNLIKLIGDFHFRILNENGDFAYICKLEFLIAPRILKVFTETSQIVKEKYGMELIAKFVVRTGNKGDYQRLRAEGKI